MRVGTFTVPATMANPKDPERRLTLDLLVDTGSTWTLLPADVVNQLGLATPWRQAVRLASGEGVTYGAGQVVIRLNGEERYTVFLAGPPGVLGLLGAVTLEEFGLAPDPVNQKLISIPGLLAASRAA